MKIFKILIVISLLITILTVINSCSVRKSNEFVAIIKSKSLENSTLFHTPVVTILQHWDTLVSDINKGEISNFLIESEVDEKIFLMEEKYCNTDINFNNKSFTILLFELLNEKQLLKLASLFYSTGHNYKDGRNMKIHYIKIIKKQLLSRYGILLGDSLENKNIDH